MSTNALTIAIGYDSREPVALEVAAHSIIRRASRPVRIIPVAVQHLAGIYTREPNGTTEFSLTRFLTPYLSDYTGFSIFMDCDVLVKCDIHDVLQMVDPRNDVSVCQHNYQPREGLKATGVQTTYPRKNWSSFMVFNNAQCQILDPLVVNTQLPAHLHRLQWARQDRIGSLPLEYNWLVGEYPVNPDAKILHYTLGGPWMEATRQCDHADDWLEEWSQMNFGMAKVSA